MKLFADINTLDKDKDTYEKSYISAIKKYPYIYLWGISESCDEAIAFFKKHNITIKGIYNINSKIYNYSYMDIPVVEESFDNIDTTAAIVTTNSYYETFRERLLKKYPNIDSNLFVFDGYFLENKNTDYYIENKDVITKCYKALKDDYSKELYDALLRYRYIRDTNIIKNLSESRSNCYLDDVFINTYKDGLYIDAGSYNADFITTLKKKVDISKSKFYIFEPNRTFYKRIINNLDKDINYKAYNMALCDKKGKMEFMSLAFSTSHIVDKKYNAYKDNYNNNIVKVNTDTLDAIIKDEKVTGIKIDIEGAESSMLIGAKKTIKRDRPIILLAIYHRWADMLKLQDYLMSLNLNYKFYIRHYSLGVSKTVLYCIPE